ncbi:MAG: complex I NDUFA9 subunit family protein, partial [Nitrospirota bacterium]
MKILITGATGFIGGEIVLGLLERGYQIRALTRNPDRARDLLPSGVECVKGDITRPDGLYDAVSGCDAIIHLVGIIFEKGKNMFDDVHYKGTVNIVTAAKQTKVKRFLHMSALGSRPDAVSNYHRTKYRGEQCVVKSGLDYTIFRPSLVFGHKDRSINLFIKMIKLMPIFPVIGSGGGRTQPVFVSDVARAFVASVEDKNTFSKTYDIGGPNTMTYEELFDLIMEVIGKRRKKLYIPIGLMRPLAAIYELLRIPVISRDQLIMLEE